MLARILFVSRTSGKTGPTTSLWLLIRRLAESYDVAVLLCGRGSFCNTLSEHGVQHWSFPSLSYRSFPDMLGLLHREKFDLVYANETSRAGRNTCWLAGALAVPYVSHVRSMEWRKGWVRSGHLLAAKAVIAVSDACAASVRRFVRKGRLHIVHNGVDLNGPDLSGREIRTRIRQELGLSPTTKLIISLGHVSPRKGQEEAIQVLQLLLRTTADVHLCIVGALNRDPDYLARVAALANTRELRGRVSLLGFRADAARLVSAADVLLHTAAADPHPRAVLEAMAAAVPVVAFAVDGVAETVVHGRTGYLIPSHDLPGAARALASLIGNEAAAVQMGRAGRARAEAEFSEAETAARVQQILQKVLAEKSRFRTDPRLAIRREENGGRR